MARKASLRQGSERDLRRARRLLREMRTGAPETQTDLGTKVDFIYKVFFREEGAKGLASARHVVQSRFEDTHDALFLPTVEALTYSKCFDDLHTYLDRMEARAPGHPLLIMPRVHAHLHSGAVARARKTCWRALQNRPPETIRRQLVALLLQMGDLERLMHRRAIIGGSGPLLDRAQNLPPPDPDGDLPVFCINLDRDAERLERARVMQTGGTVFHRSPGVSGSSLPRALLAATGLTITVPRIAQVGCHLAHMKAWEAVADTVPEDGYGLVTEDDAIFIYGPGRGLSTALDLGREAGMDLLFINFEPMRHRAFVADETPAVLGIDAALAEIYPKRVPGWGGESYLLTPKGARKLIEMAMEIGIVGPLDWQIALYGAEDLDRDRLETIGPVGTILDPLAEARRRHGRNFVIRAGVLSVPLMQQLDMGYTAHHVEVSLAG